MNNIAKGLGVAGVAASVGALASNAAVPATCAGGDNAALVAALVTAVTTVLAYLMPAPSQKPIRR